MINAITSAARQYIPKISTKEIPSQNESKNKTQSERKSLRLVRRGSLEIQDASNKSDGPLNREARGMILQYLTKNLSEVMTSSHVLTEFEQLVEVSTRNIEDVALLRVLKAHGWKGHRFFHSQSTRVDASALMLALSNLYLQTSVASLTAQSSLNASVTGATNSFTTSQKLIPTLTPTMERQSSSTGKKITTPISETTEGSVLPTVEEQLMSSQVLSFCPNILVKHLLARMDMEGEEVLDVSSSTFEAACMLVDISGFSKYSGAMCSKGMVGLDDLHKSTNEFLGHFVDVVHQYQGDVVCFAGDALICVFCVESKTLPSPSSSTVENPVRSSPTRSSILESRGSLIDGLFGSGNNAAPKRSSLSGKGNDEYFGGGNPPPIRSSWSGKGLDKSNGEHTTSLSDASAALRLNISSKTSFNGGNSLIGGNGLSGSLGGGPSTENSYHALASRRPSVSVTLAQALYGTPLASARGVSSTAQDRTIVPVPALCSPSDFDTPLATGRKNEGPENSVGGSTNIGGRLGSTVKSISDHLTRKLTEGMMGRSASNHSNNTMDPWNNYCLRALQCACELRATKNDNLGTHIAVTAGTLTLAILGGCNEEWTYIINGPCLSGIYTSYQYILPTQPINKPY